MDSVSRTLMVLDDDRVLAAIISRVAEASGFHVRCFSDPLDFLAAVRSESPSHLAVDLVLPGMDGIEVLRRLADTRCASGIILTSGMGERVLESARQTARERGLDILGVLPKPFKPPRSFNCFFHSLTLDSVVAFEYCG